MTDKDMVLAVQELVNAVQGTPRPGTGTYPLSHAVYDIAKAITDRDGPDNTDLCEAITVAGQDIAEGLKAIARAINQASST
jgi:hypothetical protein